MAKAISKLLVLFAVFSRLGNAYSYLTQEGRGLSFQHPSTPHHHHLPIAEHEETSTGGKNGKSMKSEKEIGDDEDKLHYSRSKSTKKGLKSEKFGKKAKYHNNNNQYEVEYEVVISQEDTEDGYYSPKSKSSKHQSVIPHFEYIEVGHKSSKNSKSGGKGYDSKGSKSEKVAKDGKSYKEGKSSGLNKGPKTPTVSPSPTTEPAPAMPTPHPTQAGSFGVGVPIFSLAFKLMNKAEPKVEELNHLDDATETYLYDFFFDEFEEDDFTVFEQFVTEILGFSAGKNMPVVVDFDSIASFDQLSLITPTPVQLASAIEEAFTGLNMVKYEDWLKETLPSNNIFVGSEVQYYQGDKSVPDKSRRGIGATGIAASAVAFTLLVAGAVLYKSKSNGRRGESDKLNKASGDMTVAGETFAGETYDGTVSVSASSVDYVRRYTDEEEGPKTDNLGSIPESHDADSVKPVWSDDADEIEDESKSYGRGIPPHQTRSAFRGSITSAPRTASFEDVALQAPTYGGEFQDEVMPDPSSSEDDASQMSDSELSQFVASTTHVVNQTVGGHTLEIKSLLSLDSMDENASSGTSDLSVRDNSSRRLRTVAEIEALLSSDLKDDKNSSGSGGTTSVIQDQNQTSRPRTVEEIESLLTADDDDDTIVELPFSDEDESIME